MHQHPLHAPFLPNKSSNAGHRSGVRGRTVRCALLPRFIFEGNGYSVDAVGRLGISYSNSILPHPRQLASVSAGQTMARTFCRRIRHRALGSLFQWISADEKWRGGCLSILSRTMFIKLLGVRDGQRLSRVRRSKASSKKWLLRRR